MKIETFKGADGQWYATIVASNGQPVFTSEGHANKADVVTMCQVTKKHLASAPIQTAVRR